MSKELELSGKTPLTRSEIEALSIDLLNPVLEGGRPRITRHQVKGDARDHQEDAGR